MLGDGGGGGGAEEGSFESTIGGKKYMCHNVMIFLVIEHRLLL